MVSSSGDERYSSGFRGEGRESNSLVTVAAGTPNLTPIAGDSDYDSNLLAELKIKVAEFDDESN